MTEQVVILLLACAVLGAAAFLGFVTALQYRNMLADKEFELSETRRGIESYKRVHRVEFELPRRSQK